MKRYILMLVLVLAIAGAQAQKITRSFRNVSLSDVLKTIDKASDRYNINFMYDELEDFTVTADVRDKSIPEAVREVVGFYPMQITQVGDIISVECVQKEKNKFTGRIVDEQGKAMEFANVALLSKTDSSFVNGGVSNADGRFVIPCFRQDVIVRVTFVGYKTAYRAVAKIGDVGTIRMRPDAHQLANVEVKSVRPVHKLGKEGMITNVQGTSLSIAGTASDVLSLLPNVDGKDGTFSVFGKKGEPLIYINGRQMRSKNELAQIKSEDIKHVEVITNPGARYSAEVNSVIKITTVKKAGDGWSGNGYVYYKQATRETLYESAELNYRKGGLDLNAYLSHANAKMNQEQTTQTIIYNKVEENINVNSMPYHIPNEVNAYISANYDFGKDNFAGIRYSLYGVESDNGYEMDSENIFPDGTHSMLNYNTNLHYPFATRHSVNAYYTGRIGKLGIDFNADYVSHKDRTTQLMQVSENGEKAETVNSDTRSSSHMHASKLLLTYPLWKGELSAGYEYSDTRRTGKFDGTGGVESHTDDKINENTLSAFMDYNMQLGKWTASAGVRYEHTVSDYYDHGVLSDEQSRRYDNLFPNASISYNDNNMQILLGYSMRTQRPYYHNLSSNMQFDTRYLYEGGNPLLRPSKRHIVEAQAVYKWLSLYASFAKNIDDIQHYDFLYGEEAIANSYTNMPHNENLNIQLSASRKFFNFWEPNWSIGVNKQFFDASQLGIEGVSMERPRWRLKLNNNFHLPWGINLGVNWRWWSKGHIDSELQYSSSQLDFSLYKAFLNNSLTVRINANDVLKDSWDKRNYQGHYMNYMIECYGDNRFVSVTVSYRFNTARSKYKGTGAGNAEKSRL